MGLGVRLSGAGGEAEGWVVPVGRAGDRGPTENRARWFFSFQLFRYIRFLRGFRSVVFFTLRCFGFRSHLHPFLPRVENPEQGPSQDSEQGLGLVAAACTSRSTCTSTRGPEPQGLGRGPEEGAGPCSCSLIAWRVVENRWIFRRSSASWNCKACTQWVGHEARWLVL